jgi:urease accessory protein
MSTDLARLRFQTFLSPAFPVGSYAFSHGLEYAVESRLVKDEAGLAEWTEGILSLGLARSEGVLFHRAFEAAGQGHKALLKTAELGAALLPTAELGLESLAQGEALLKALNQAWPSPELDTFLSGLGSAGIKPSLAVALGAAAAWQGLALPEALALFLQSLAANLVWAGVRLIPLGQAAGLRVLSGLEDAVLRARDAALNAGTDDWGSATVRVDWCSMRHETQYTRLFRS